METKNKTKGFVLCVRYSKKISLHNRRLQAFVEHTSECSRCREKVMYSDASAKIIEADPSIEAICAECAGT